MKQNFLYREYKGMEITQPNQCPFCREDKTCSIAGGKCSAKIISNIKSHCPLICVVASKIVSDIVIEKLDEIIDLLRNEEEKEL